MAAEIVPEHITSKNQKPLETSLSPIERARITKYGTTHYKPEYAAACFKLLAGSNMAKTKSHCCALLQCSKPTLLKWMKKYPEFGQAINDGLEIGKTKWRNKIAKHAWEPSAQVNNGLIKLLSANVYGIKDESEANIVINNTNSQDPETIMKDRGIPIPDIGIEDIDE
jgi:hypothetical protein